MTRSRIALVTIGTAIAWCTGIYISRTFRATAYAQTTPVALTVEYGETSYDAAGTERRSVEETYAKRSDGSHVRVRRSINGRAVGVRRIVDLVKQQAITVDPLTQSIVTYNLPAHEVQFFTSSPLDCAEGPNMKRNNGVQDKMSGMDVVHYSGTLVGSENPTERWYIPSLNCLVVREEVVSPGYRTIRTVSSLTLGDPDPGLFQVPYGYLERSPSEVLSLAKDRKIIPRFNPKSAADLDAVYRNRNETP